jgi:branched-chain amino acid transport system ATP-binding protein
MLSVERIEAGYSGAKVLQGVEFDLGEGEALALVGRNGMGKTTTVRTLFGLLPLKAGRILFGGRSLGGRPPFAIAREGLGLVPEGRQVFPTLTVEENLVATAASPAGRARWTLGEVFRLFPRLAERRGHYGNQLSGGEQQMLAIGRALMTNPRLLVLDEATEGLAPLIRGEIWACLKALKREGLSILVIDKNLKALLEFVDGVAVIEKGRIVWRGSAAAFGGDPSIVERFLRVGGTAPAGSSSSVGKGSTMDKILAPGITKAGEGIDNISWSILGQTYVPKTVSESAFAWHATFPPETFVPPHIHPTQDEFIYMFEGQLELMLDGRTNFANPGDLVRMPMGLPHAIFNKSGRIVKCMFWVAPTRRLYDLFWAIHNMAEQTPAEVVALAAKHEVDFLPPPETTK